MTSPKALLHALQLKPRKQLGQNFLVDPSTALMLVRRSGFSSGDVVLEIGAGLGALTLPLSDVVSRVYAVEKDDRMAALLRNELRNSGRKNVVLINRDIFDVDVEALAAAEQKKLLVTGNLPYNISSQVLILLIHIRAAIDRAILMFQKEVVQRLTAVPKTKEYGRLSVMLQYCADLRVIASVAPRLFYPRPKVASEVIEIRFKTRIEKPVHDEAVFSRIVKTAFAKRRKTLRNALKSGEMNLSGPMVEQILSRAGIDPSRRAETLDVSEFIALEHTFSNKGAL